MRLYLVRHGKPLRGGVAPDADPHLAHSGERQIERLGRALMRRAAKPQWLATSPAARCRESAEILAAALGLPASAVTVEPLLGLESSPLLASATLALHAGAPDGMLVGHEPWLAALCARLLAGATHAPVRFECSSCACIEVQGPVDAPRGVLSWLLAPESPERSQ